MPEKGDYIEETIIVWQDMDEIELTFKIYGWADFPRGKNYQYAFCQGDPLAERGEGLIALYVECTRSWFETCPVCQGRAS